MAYSPELDKLIDTAAKETWDIFKPVLDGWNGTGDLWAMMAEAMQMSPAWMALQNYIAPGQTKAMVGNVFFYMTPYIAQDVMTLKPKV